MESMCLTAGSAGSSRLVLIVLLLMPLPGSLAAQPGRRAGRVWLAAATRLSAGPEALVRRQRVVSLRDTARGRISAVKLGIRPLCQPEPLYFPPSLYRRICGRPGRLLPGSIPGRSCRMERGGRPGRRRPAGLRARLDVHRRMDAAARSACQAAVRALVGIYHPGYRLAPASG